MKLWVVWGYDDIYGGFHGMKEVEIYEGTENEAIEYARELADSVIGSYSDIYDAKYIGRGVTRYIQAYWEDGETKKCVDRILYRVTPSIKNVLLRSVSVFAVIYILSSPKTAELSGKIISFICSKIGG